MFIGRACFGNNFEHRFLHKIVITFTNLTPSINWITRMHRFPFQQKRVRISGHWCNTTFNIERQLSMRVIVDARPCIFVFKLIRSWMERGVLVHCWGVIWTHFANNSNSAEKKKRKVNYTKRNDEWATRAKNKMQINWSHLRERCLHMFVIRIIFHAITDTDSHSVLLWNGRSTFQIAFGEQIWCTPPTTDLGSIFFYRFLRLTLRPIDVTHSQMC